MITVNATNLKFCALFTVALVVSASLGLASKQSASARVVPESEGAYSNTIQIIDFVDDEPDNGTAIIGSAPIIQVIGTAPTYTQIGTALPKTSSKPAEQPKVVATTQTTPEETKVATATSDVQAVATTQRLAAVVPAAALPTTGSAGMFGLFAGTGALGFAGHKLFLRRKR